MARNGGRRWRAAACLVVAAALAACTGTPEPASSAADDDTTASPAPSASVVPGPTAEGNRRLRLTTVARVPLTGLSEVSGLRLSGQRAVVGGCAACGDEAGAVHEVDLRSGRVRRVAASAYARGAVLPSGLHGDRLVWLDTEPVAVQFGGRTRWRLQLLELGTGRSRTLAASGRTDRSVPPWAVAGGGQVAWQEWAGDDLAGRVRVADVGTGVVSLVRDVPGPLGAVSGGAVFFVGASDPDGPGADVGDAEVPADAYALPLPGGLPARLSATHDVGSVTSDGRTAVWTTPRGLPRAVWAARVAGGGGDARIVYRGATSERAVGRDAVAVLTNDDAIVVVAPLEGGPAVIVPDVPFVPAGLAADGSRMAWVAAPGRDVPVDRRHPLELVVVEVG